MKSALYNQSGKPPISFNVVKTHPNGTVDLADAAGVVKITECQITTDGAPGTCTLAAAPKGSKAKQSKAESKAESKAIEDAEAALDAAVAAAEADPANAELSAAVESAQTALDGLLKDSA